MYLEKLELQGFKSFANKNKLIFSGIINGKKRGITSVVGPNGSGKSNIADAIRWVLGEQSSKLLRSKKSDDVIFLGSDKKGRLNFAEVSLFLNNQDPNFKFKEIYLERSEDEDSKKENKAAESDIVDAFLMLPEIVITRRVYRDGNSEYLINNNKVRLSDVQIFLAKASFGQKTYSVIGQGMVENFLNTSPAERKSFFDEATGVKQYQIKRDLSLGKLETSQENLAQVEMLLNEIEPRLSSLTRQVGKLKKREHLEEDLNKNQINYYGFLWKEINSKLEFLNKEIKEAESKKDEIKFSLRDKKEEVEKMNQESSLNDEFLNLQKTLSETKEEIAKLERQKTLINNWKDLRGQNKDNGELDYLYKEKNTYSQEFDILNEKINLLSPEFKDEQELKNLEEKLYKLENEQKEQQREAMKLEALLEIKLEKSGNFDISFLFSRQSDIKKELLQIEEDSKILKNEIEGKEVKLNKKIEEEKKIIEKLDDLEEELKKVRADYNPSNVQKINSDISALLNKINGLEDSSDLSFFKQIIKEIKSSLADLLEFVSGQKFDNTIEKINQKIHDLKTEKEKINNEHNSFKLELNILKNKDQQFNTIREKLTKELADVEKKIETSDKEENIEDLKIQKNQLDLKLKELFENLSLLKIEAEKLKIEKENWRDEKNQIEKSFYQIQEKIVEIDNKISAIKSNDSKNQARLENLEDEIKLGAFLEDFKQKDFSESLEEEIVFVNGKLEELGSLLSSLELKLSNFNNDQEKRRQYLFALQREIHSLESQTHSFYQKINNLQIELAREETRMEDLENNILNDKIELNTIKEYKLDENLKIDLNYLKTEISRIKNQLELIGGIDPEVEKEYSETKKRYEFLFEQTEDLNKTIKSLEKVIVELDVLIKDRFETEFKVISEKFNEYFKILFNGGQAKIFPIKEEPLEIENGESAKEKNEQDLESQSTKNLKKIKYLKKYNAIGLSGVDILAVPPGKKITSVSMLSGGERALTAIALICAIISANPAPFVVLDEVDAALDEANSERLARILDDLSDKTQFIAITHNRATMKRANILYGVTMGSDGISKLLSVKLDEYIKNS